MTKKKDSEQIIELTASLVGASKELDEREIVLKLANEQLEVTAAEVERLCGEIAIARGIITEARGYLAVHLYPFAPPFTWETAVADFLLRNPNDE
jgi:arginine repressor